MKKLVVINLGSTSTKIAYFEDDRCVRAEPLPHPAAEIQAFASNWDQYDYRKAAILDFMDRTATASGWRSWTPLSAGAATPSPSTAGSTASLKRCWSSPAA